MHGFAALGHAAHAGWNGFVDSGVGIALWLLAVTFFVAGVPKLRHPRLAAMAIVDFGLTKRVRPSIGAAVGAIEVAVGVSLIAPPASRVGVVLASCLLLLFAVLIGRSLVRGERFACFCFGIESADLSRWTLLRTGGLTAVAAAALVASVEHGAPAASVHTAALRGVAAVSILASAAVIAQIPLLVRLNHHYMHPGGA